MSLDALRARLPAYAKDLSLNLSSLAGETLLSDQQKWGAFLASAHATGQPDVVGAVEAAAAEAGLTPEAANAAKAAAASVSPPTWRLQGQSSSVCRASSTRSVSSGLRPTLRLVT